MEPFSRQLVLQERQQATNRRAMAEQIAKVFLYGLGFRVQGVLFLQRFWGLEF